MYAYEDNWIGVSIRCPHCREWIDVEAPDRPPTGGKAEAWCRVCGKRFMVEV